MYRKQFFSYFSYSVIVILSWLYVCIFWKIFFFVLSLWWYCLNTLQLPEVLCFGLSDECTHWLSITMSDTPFCLSSSAHLIYSRRGLKPTLVVTGWKEGCHRQIKSVTKPTHRVHDFMMSCWLKQKQTNKKTQLLWQISSSATFTETANEPGLIIKHQATEETLVFIVLCF